MCSSAGCRYLLQWYLTRSLSLEAFGFYSTILVWSEFLAIYLGLGLDQASVRFIPKYRIEKQLGLLKGFLKFSLVVVLLLWLFIWILSSFLYFIPAFSSSSQLKEIITWTMILIPPTFLVKLLTEQSKSFERPVAAFIPSLVLRPIFTILFLQSLFLLGVGLRISIVVASVGCSLGGVALIQWLLLRKNIPVEAPEYRVSDWLGTSWPLLLVGSLIFFQGQFDLMLLGIFRPGAETGIYSAASKVAMLCSFAIFAINGVYTPKIVANLAENKTEASQMLLDTATRWAAFMTATIFGLILIGGKKILALFGEEYTSGYLELVILCFTYLMGSIYGLSIYLLSASGHHYKALRLSAVSVVAAFLLGVFLIHKYGGLGAAIANLLANIFFTVLSVRTCKSQLGINPTLSSVLRK